MASPGKKAFLVRIHPELWKDLEKLAAADLRSINGEIEYLLRDAVERRKKKRVASVEQRRKVATGG